MASSLSNQKTSQSSGSNGKSGKMAGKSETSGHITLDNLKAKIRKRRKRAADDPEKGP
jgi:hypothetical protein